MNEMNANAVETKEPENATAATPPKIIAVDFDGCLAVNKWPEVGEPIWSSSGPTVSASPWRRL